IILVSEKPKDDFEGRSYSIIDGQQRLITFSLLGSFLYNKLLVKKGNVDSFQLKDDSKYWIKKEYDSLLSQVEGLICGRMRKEGEDVLFPKIVREDSVDNRSSDTLSSETGSNVANFLSLWFRVLNNSESEPLNDKDLNEISADKNFINQALYIKKWVDNLCDGFNLGELNLNLDDPSDFDYTKSGFRELFKNLDEFSQQEKNRIISDCDNHRNDLVDTIWTISFGRYLMNSVVISTVKTREKYAFDIFDSLNTTGEPLTAIQTFIPKLTKFEKEQKNFYSGSESEKEMEDVEGYLNGFNDSQSFQNESKALVTTFANYLSGDVLYKKLDEQRKYLNNVFSNLNSPEDKRNFVKKLANIGRYKSKFWKKNEIPKQLDRGLVRNQERPLILMCLSFLKDLKMDMSIPPLARYFFDLDNYENNHLESAIKAFTSFVLLRRAYTGSTDGIDRDVRKLMNGSSTYKSLYSAYKSNGKISQIGKKVLPIKEFKSHLITLLEAKVGNNRENWVKIVASKDLARRPPAITKFLLFAANENSYQQDDVPYLIEKGRPSPENNYLRNDLWDSDVFATIEHIAPQSPQPSGWDKMIYSPDNLYLKDCIGNLTLLPQPENSAFGNQSWENKKALYDLFSTGKKGEFDKKLKRISDKNLNLNNNNIEFFRDRSRLGLNDPLLNVQWWDKNVIQKRAENIAKLAAETVSPWLYG
ncbi:MAG: DUF1524 domain-containing protein, partial [Flavobacteriales bacterium]